MEGWHVRPQGSGAPVRVGLRKADYFTLPTAGPILQQIAHDGASLARQCYPNLSRLQDYNFHEYFSMQGSAIWDAIKDAMVKDKVWVSTRVTDIELTAQTESMVKSAPQGNTMAAMCASVHDAYKSKKVSICAALTSRVVELAHKKQVKIPVTPLRSTIPEDEVSVDLRCSLTASAPALGNV